METLALHRFDLSALLASNEVRAAFPREPGTARLKWRDVDLGVTWLEDAWALSDTQGLFLNRIAPQPFVRVRHGDVLELSGDAVMVVDARQLWRSEARIAPGIAGAREVLHDHLVEHGRAAPWNGELGALLGRGLTVEHAHGFPSVASFDFGVQMTRAWPERWLRLLISDPAWAFVERVSFSGLRGDEASWLENTTRVLAERGVCVTATEAHGDELGWEEERRDEVRLFDQPPASSWLTEEVK